MRKLLSVAAASLLLLVGTGCATLEPSTDDTPSPTVTTTAPSASSSPTPSTEPTAETPTVPSTPQVELPPGVELPEGFNPEEFFDESGNFDLEKYLQWLEEHGVGTADPRELDCTPFVEWCHYHPGFGNCPWDVFYGGYLCEQYHMDFAGGCEYRFEAGAYLCREGDSGW